MSVDSVKSKGARRTNAGQRVQTVPRSTHWRQLEYGSSPDKVFHFLDCILFHIDVIPVTPAEEEFYFQLTTEADTLYSSTPRTFKTLDDAKRASLKKAREFLIRGLRKLRM